MDDRRRDSYADWRRDENRVVAATTLSTTRFYRDHCEFQPWHLKGWRQLEFYRVEIVFAACARE